MHEESHGNADLVAHFFRRAFDALRLGGCFGLIATNTIGQGDTRASGLRWICTHGGTVYAARKRTKWPGQAAVVVSVIWATKCNQPGPFDLDGRSVPLITAYLFHAGGSDNPAALRANAGKSFQGSIVLGMGFTFDDTDKTGIANPQSLMRELIAKDPRNAERIFPYIGREDLLEDPLQRHSRFVIDFGEVEEAEAKRFVDLYRVVEEKVKPERMRQKDNPDGRRRKEFWWQWGRYTPALQEATQNLDRVLMHAFTSSFLAFAFIPRKTVVAGPHNSFALDSSAAFCALQSRVHEVWVRFFGSSLEDRLRYTPTDCFETFPFPAGCETNANLETAGREYYELRARLMVQNNEGLTKTYNRFHDPEEASPDILRLRELHAAMDRAVLEAYGWPDLIPQCQCEFLLDYEDEDDGAEETGRRRKKPWRYRWPDLVRDEVLARLLKLNAERAQEETLAGERAALTSGAAAGKKKPKKPRATTTSAAPAQGDLLPSPQKDLFE